MADKLRDRGIASFMIRFAQERWRDARGEPHVQWRGFIRHVQGDEEIPFTDAAEAIAFMQKHLAQLTKDALPNATKSEQEKLMRESVKLWEQFAASYNHAVTDAMERTMKQSQAFRQQMDEAVQRSLRVWTPPTATTTGHRGEQSQMLDALENIMARLENLSERLEKLEKATPRGRASKATKKKK